MGVGQWTCSSANSAGIPATNSVMVSAAMTIHAPRARTSRRPRRRESSACGSSVGTDQDLTFLLLSSPDILSLVGRPNLASRRSFERERLAHHGGTVLFDRSGVRCNGHRVGGTIPVRLPRYGWQAGCSRPGRHFHGSGFLYLQGEIKSS